MGNRTTAANHNIEKQVIEAAIKLGLLLLLASLCYLVLSPFIMLVAWSAILSIALYPIHLKLTKRLNHRPNCSASFITLIFLAVFLIPSVMLAGGLAENMSGLIGQIEQETLKVPPPSDDVKGWPLIGEPLYTSWNQASQNLESFISNNKQSLKTYGSKLLSMFGDIVSGVLMFTFAIIISGVLMANATTTSRGIQLLADRLTSHTKSPLPGLAAATIRSVAVGVIGVATIQAALGGLGMLAVGLPAAVPLMLLLLLLSIAQLPALLVLGPVIAYVFSYADTTTAVVFMIWSVLVGLSDNLLKPLLLGKGVDVPTLVVLLGAIGGMLNAGIVGLFVGAVTLALTYTLLVAWLTGGGFAASSKHSDNQSDEAEPTLVGSEGDS